MRPPSQFAEDITNEDEPDPRMRAMMICTQLAGRAIIRVVGRCNEAQENNNLGRKFLKYPLRLVRAYE